MQNQFLKLYQEGLNDSEIAKLLKVNHVTIHNWRIKHGLKSNFYYKSKIKKEDFDKVYKETLSDEQLGKLLGVSDTTVYFFRKKYNYNRPSLNEAVAKKLTQFQKEVLIGTLLGDSSLKRDNLHASITCGHGIKQKEYCLHKTEIFKSIGAVCTYYDKKIPDKRTGKFYCMYRMRTSSNPELDYYYDSFYKNKRKIIPTNLFNDFSAVSLAFMFMDDGYKTPTSYNISTNCFSLGELIEFQNMLLHKFEIETTIYKSHVLHIKANSSKLFKYLVQPYIIDSMKYKL